MKVLYGVVFLVIGVFAEDNFTDEALQILYDCGTKEFSLCMKERVLEYVEYLPNHVDIDGVRIKQNDVERTGRYLNPQILPDEPSARESALNNVLMDRILNYFSSHTFEFKLPAKTIDDFKRSFDSEARKKKKKGMNIMMLLQMKMMAIGAIMLKLVGLVAFKALIVGKIALVLVLIIALKKLVESKQHTSSYEVVAHPHYDDHHHYDRSFGQDQAYRAYADDKFTDKS